jgi:hypothetical protein
VAIGSGDPEKRVGGADFVIAFDPNDSPSNDRIRDYAVEVFCHEFEADTSSKSYRYYVQCVEAVSADELWLECEYVNSYDDTTEYTITTVVSDETITARSGADDWDQYIEVTGIQPAVASKVRIRGMCAYYHATAVIYIDPKVVIS